MRTRNFADVAGQSQKKCDLLIDYDMFMPLFKVIPGEFVMITNIVEH